MPQEQTNKNTFKYWGFGLTISSEIEFPELLPFDFETPDLTIGFGDIPVIAEGPVLQNNVFSYVLDPDYIFISMTDVADYAMLNGSSIIIKLKDPMVETGFIRVIVLTYLIAAILWQRGLVPLHCSSLLHNGSLICIAGDSGAGKSTSVAGLCKRGYQPFSDDIAVINPSLMVNSSYPIVKLWEDAQEKLNHDIFNDRSFVIEGTLKKFGIFFHQRFNTGNYSVKKIFILKKDDIAVIETKRLTNAGAFLEMRKHIFRHLFVKSKELKQLAFFTISALVNNTDVYEITRPLVCDVDYLVNELEKLIVLDD